MLAVLVVVLCAPGTAAAQLKAANIRLLGAVLTNRTFPIPEFIYRWL